MVEMRLQWLFVWLGLAVMAMIVCLHLYLNETRLMGEVKTEVERIEQWKETGVEWGAPVISGQMRGLIGGEMALRRLNSVPITISKHDPTEKEIGLEVERDGLERAELEVERDAVVEGRKGGEEEDMEGEIVEEVEGEEEDVIDDVMEEEEEVYVEDKSPIEDEVHNKSRTLITSFENQTDQFFLPSFSLPTPKATLPLTQLVKCAWMTELRDYLTSITRSPRLVSLVSSDYKYREVLLNWLITAQVKVDKPLSNVLVLSLDKSLHTLLKGKEIPCVHIPTSCLLRPSLKLTKHVAFTQVHIMRVLVMRLLNHWRYDVANYDSDALILRNPEPRYKELSDCHLIGSVGHFPKQMDKKWGTAVCIGVVMIRASPQTGQSTY